LRGVVDRWRRSNGLWQQWLTAPLIYLDMLPPLEKGADGASDAGAARAGTVPEAAAL
jgi:hypothetical protein